MLRMYCVCWHFQSPKSQIARSHHPLFLTTVTHSTDRSSKTTNTFNENLANVLHCWHFLGQSMPKNENRSVAHTPHIWRMYRIPPMVIGVRPSDFDTTSIEECSPSLAPSLIRCLAQSLIRSANRSPTPSPFRSLAPLVPSNLAPPLSLAREQQRTTTSNDEQRATTERRQTTTEQREAPTSTKQQQRATTSDTQRGTVAESASAVG